MIKIKQLKDRLQNDLNENMFANTEFKLFTDTGKYKKSHRSIENPNKIKKYINGVFTITASNISNASTGFEFGTMTARVELLVKCNEEKAKIEKEYGENGAIIDATIEQSNEDYLDSIRNHLDKVFAEHVNFDLIDEQGKTYDLSANYSIAISGQRNPIAGIGDSYTFVFFVYYNLIQAGENSRDYKIYLDGKILPYGVFTLRRVPAQTANVYSGQKKAVGKSINDNTILGISIDCPAFVSQTNDVIKNYILNGEENIAHILTLELNEDEQNYLVLFGEVDATAQGTMNVGQVISFVETIEEYGIISFPDYYKIYQNNTNNDIAFSNDKKFFNITKKEFSNLVSVGDVVATYETLESLTEI